MDLAARTLELIDIPSESRDETAIVEHVLRVLGDRARDAGDTCVLAGTTTRGDRPLVLLAGHVDTVPAQDNRPGWIDGGSVHGLGAADMLGGVAVMLELALAPPPNATCDLGVVLFGREELPFGDSALTPLLEREPGLRSADLAIVMEPTANTLHAGCVGNINATWTFRGTAGHSARPWLADNAIHRAARGIAALAEREPVDHVFDGLTYREVVSVTTIEGGVALNVVPDACRAAVNMRYAPGTTPHEAEATLRSLTEPHGELEITGNAPSGRTHMGDPLVQRLTGLGLDVAPKQAWTPVAELSAAGVNAVNFGPGEPRFAHRRDEQVGIEALEECHATLVRFLCG